jgi:hypothetical protein
MGIVQSARDITENAYAFRYREAFLFRYSSAQGLTFNEGHREIRKSFCIAGCEKRDDVRLLELRSELDLALESIRADAGGELW